MNTIIGQAATGDKFYIRKKLIERLWRKIEAENNILLSAPRRIGKTSIMLYCLNNPKENYDIIYLITESVNNQNEFYRKLVKDLDEKLKTSKKVKNYIRNIVNSNKIKSIGPDGVTFDNKEVNYYEDFVNISEQLELDGCKMIIMIDEFAQTVENIMQDEGDQSAIKFLESVRELRINPKISDKVQFIFAGSIGLENIASQLNSISTINDLYPFQVTPFSIEEAEEYIYTIPLKNEKYDFQKENIKYLLDRLAWNIPYFINIILDEVDDICFDQGTKIITKEIIDVAFKNSLKNRTYFEHWHRRLRKAYKQNYYNFSKDILNCAAKNGSISRAEISNIAIGLEISETYKDVLNSLIYDGYLNNQNNQNIYVFNSPLLREWWFNEVTN
ncbi:MAG: ATP-binding protein [Salinivirgaceae bacterium]|nr:ATP-binding protein [Salinivirgaceae bacterium]